MRGRFAKVGALFLVLAVALAGLGIGYAHWSDSLTIEGTVDTGELDWEFTVFSITDMSAPPETQPDYHCNDGFDGWTFWADPDGKNVGWGEGTLVDSDGDGDNDTLELTLHNVYPCYFNSVSVYARNNGTIPMVIDRIIIDGTVIRAEPCPVVGLDLNDDGLDDIEIWWGNALGQQREPGELFPEMSFWIHVLEDAPQGETLSFTMELVAVQWNAP